MSTQHTTAQDSPPIKPKLTRNQIRSFWAAWGGWSMDGMDSFIYSLVLVPALSELLPRSGIPATPANIGYYGGFYFMLFMVGYGTALIWGPIADRFGRVRTMMFSILCFSLFTLLTSFATGIWSFAIFRFMSGVGIGGEWSVGAALVSEDWPEERRAMGGALMHTGYYIGFLFAALANVFIGSRFGWRWMFALGGAPALLIGLIRNNVQEPERWESRLRQLGEKWTIYRAFFQLFSPQYRRKTILNSLYLIVSLIGLWAGSVYAPAAITFIAQREGRSVAEAARLASYSTALLGITTVLGALIVPGLADKVGRKGTLAIFYIVMLSAIVLAFGHVFYLRQNALGWFLACSALLGLGGANFIVYSFWLPEQYGTECRASAFAFITNIGRFAAAGFTFLVGIGIRHFQTMGIPVAMSALAFIVGLLLIPFGEETRGKRLPT
jgi:MFS family permease